MEGGGAIPGARVERGRRMGIHEVMMKGPWQPRDLHIPETSWLWSQVYWPLAINSHWAGKHLSHPSTYFWTVNHSGFEQIPFCNSVISPLDVKSSHCAANNTQKNLPLVFPKPKVAGERRQKTYLSSQDLHLLLSTSKVSTKQGGGGGISLWQQFWTTYFLQEVRICRRQSCCDVPSHSLKARVSLSHQDWLQQEPK